MGVFRDAGLPGRSGHREMEKAAAAGQSLKEQGRGYEGLRGAADLGKVK